jgi:hypothetical protein
MWKVRIDIHVRPYVKYSVHCADFHENQNHLINIRTFPVTKRTKRGRNVEEANKISFTL